MKRLLIFLFVLSAVHCFAQDSTNVYKIRFKAIDSSNINMSDYAGKQILVVEFDALNPNSAQLQSLDSLAKSRSGSLQVIGIPVNNTDTSISKKTLIKLLRDTLRLSFVISDMGHANKSSNSQHTLLKWITHVSSNTHFDSDIIDDGRMFMISQAGVLYASLGSITSINGARMLQVLNNQP